jgi:putative transposase
MRKQIVEMVKKKRKLHKRKGSVKVHGELKPDFQATGIKCGRDKFLDILREENMLIHYRKRYKKTTDSKHKFKRYPNLIMDLEIKRAEQVFVSDITFIRTKQGFLHLFLVTDAYSKQIMGWELSENMKTENAIKALQMAIKNRRYPHRELIHHSDRGFQYCHPSYIELQNSNGIKPSMTTKYDPYENAIAERVNGILKTEYEIGEGFVGLKDAKREIKFAIWLYNTDRPHMSCHGLTPVVAHIIENYELKKWSRKFFSMDISLEKNKTYF